MNFVTLEVDIDRGQIIPRVPELLPDKGTGRLTLLSASSGNIRKQGSVTDFLAKWAGAFSSPSLESDSDDARLVYLLAKHLK